MNRKQIRDPRRRRKGIGYRVETKNAVVNTTTFPLLKKDEKGRQVPHPALVKN